MKTGALIWKGEGKSNTL